MNITTHIFNRHTNFILTARYLYVSLNSNFTVWKKYTHNIVNCPRVTKLNNCLFKVIKMIELKLILHIQVQKGQTTDILCEKAISACIMSFAKISKKKDVNSLIIFFQKSRVCSVSVYRFRKRRALVARTAQHKVRER